MSKEYYLIPKELIDSRIEELNKEKKYNSYTEVRSDWKEAQLKLKEFQQLTQQSELVKVEEVINPKNCIEDLVNWVTEFMSHNEPDEFDKRLKKRIFKIQEQGFKLIKTIKK